MCRPRRLTCTGGRRQSVRGQRLRSRHISVDSRLSRDAPAPMLSVCTIWRARTTTSTQYGMWRLKRELGRLREGGPPFVLPPLPCYVWGMHRAGSTQTGTLQPHWHGKLIPASLEGRGRADSSPDSDPEPRPRALTEGLTDPAWSAGPSGELHGK